MATENLNFAAQVDAWVKKTERRMEAVFKESTQRVVSEMQTPSGEGGNMPIDTGFLRNSVQATTDKPIPINPNANPVKPVGHVRGDVIYPYRSGDISLTILGSKIGQIIYVTYTAAYARHQENRRGFVRLAAQRWQAIVSEVTREARSRVK